MIKHIVMIKLKDSENKKQNIVKLKNDLESLAESIPELLKMEVGLNFSDKPTALDLVLTAEFDNIIGLNKYRVHPEHVKILNFLKEIVEKSTVVDYEIN